MDWRTYGAKALKAAGVGAVTACSGIRECRVGLVHT
jgi:hypothetical protein